MITPWSFDPVTAAAMVDDAERRVIEARARCDAERGVFDPPPVEGRTYADQMFDNMRRIVYRETYTRRLARIERKAAQGAHVEQ